MDSILWFEPPGFAVSITSIEIEVPSEKYSENLLRVSKHKQAYKLSSG
jgi:hypothetical protein